MVDNFNIIKPLLIFENPFDCYVVVIMHRNKDNDKKIYGNNKNRIIKYYLIRNVDYLISKYDEMKMLSQQFNARVMIYLNKRNEKTLCLQTIKLLSDMIASENYTGLDRLFITVAGQYHSEKNKKFLIDLDIEHIKFKYDIINFINTLEPIDKTNKLIVEVPSKNGLHLITTSFNLQKFNLKYPDIEVHKDNPTNLYIP